MHTTASAPGLGLAPEGLLERPGAGAAVSGRSDEAAIFS